MMKLHIYTLCYNEIDILPFVIDYWKALKCHVTVFDNHSTDGSTQFLKRIDFIDVRQYDSDNLLNDQILTDIKNTCWKESLKKDDFAIVCDMDECIYSEDIQHEMKYMAENEIAAVIPTMYNLISYTFPKYNGQLIHNITKNYYQDIWEDYIDKYIIGKVGPKEKMLMFDVRRMKETNYKIGSYENNAIYEGKMIRTDNIKCFHLHDVGLKRKVIRYKQRAERMSKINTENGYSDFYLEPKNKIVRDFMEDMRRSKTL